MLTITNAQGRRFNVVCVRKGDRHGPGKALVHDLDKPLLEFYDATFEGTRRFDPEGQFIMGYYASILLNLESELGLQFHVSRPDWKLDLTSLRPLWDWIKAACPDNERGGTTK